MAITTTTASTTVRSTGLNGSAPPGDDITVTVTVNGVASDPVTLTVKVPNSLQLLGAKDKLNAIYGYTSEIHYRILDQFGDALPSLVPLNEQFTSASSRTTLATTGAAVRKAAAPRIRPTGSTRSPVKGR